MSASDSVDNNIAEKIAAVMALSSGGSNDAVVEGEEAESGRVCDDGGIWEIDPDEEEIDSATLYKCLLSVKRKLDNVVSSVGGVDKRMRAFAQRTTILGQPYRPVSEHTDLGHEQTRTDSA